jgi:hypothetical protein
MTPQRREGRYPVRDIPLFNKARKVLPIVADLMADDPYFCFLSLLALEEIEKGAGGHVTVLLESEDQAALDHLRTLLQSTGRTPLECLLERLRTKDSKIDYVLGANLEDYIRDVLPIIFETKPLTQGVLRVEHLSPENPIRVLDYTADGMIIELPDRASIKHLLELDAYRQSRRPLRRLGRPPKPRDAPITRGNYPNLLARQAWELKKQGLHWTTIAKTLLKEPIPTERRAWDRLRHRVRRLYERGRLDEGR